MNFEEKLKEKVKAFFDAWLEHNTNKMLKHTTLTYRAYHIAKNISDWYGEKKLLGFKVKESKKVVDAMYDTKVEIHYSIGNLELRKLVTARAVCEEQAFIASVNGNWGVNPISILKESEIPKEKKKVNIAKKRRKHETN